LFGKKGIGDFLDGCQKVVAGIETVMEVEEAMADAIDTFTGQIVEVKKIRGCFAGWRRPAKYRSCYEKTAGGKQPLECHKINDEYGIENPVFSWASIIRLKRRIELFQG
jgi:hypothetical protein